MVVSVFCEDLKEILEEIVAIHGHVISGSREVLSSSVIILMVVSVCMACC